jgi:pyruvate/2-oxoglutarate/acetoin dehydrogenase E1 component
MKYVEFINSLIKEQVENQSEIILFGQNIDAGSSLSGLTRGLSLKNNSLIINTQNSENLLVGVGFGMMLNNVSSVFFMKQLDFLLLGIDHLVNTYNIIRQSNPKASFTIFPVTVDSGYEGPQSSLNNLDDFSSIAGVEGYTFTNTYDTKKIISNKFLKPGFRILTTGQRLLRQDVIEIEAIKIGPDHDYFQYNEGGDITIVCFNQTFDYGIEMHDQMQKKNIHSSLFTVNSHLKSNYKLIIDDIKYSKRLIIFDDSKSRNKLSDFFLKEVLRECNLKTYKMLVRDNLNANFSPSKDNLEIDYLSVIDEIFK